MNKKPVQQNGAKRPPANRAKSAQPANRTKSAQPERPAPRPQQPSAKKPAERGAKKPAPNYKQSEFIRSKGNLPGNTDRKRFKTRKKRSAKPSRTEKELNRVMNEKTPAKKKRSFRGRNYVLYYILFAVVAVVVLVILSNTVLFRCTEIEVVGNVRYTPEQIIEGSQLKTGDNLLHIDAQNAAKSVVDRCLYVDEAEVRRSFPTKLIITVKEADVYFCISENGKTAAVSRKGRIIKYLDSAGDILTLKGFEPESLELGAWVKSKNETKNDIPWEMLSLLEEAGLTNVTEIDISDRYSPKVTIDGRIILNLGGATELESKFLVAKALIDKEIGENESVIISLSNPESPAVRPNNSAPQDIENSPSSD